MVPQKLKALWRVIFSRQVSVIAQHRSGQDFDVVGWGNGDLRDMVLGAVAHKKVYNHMLDELHKAAAETGELHALQQLKDALDVLGQA